MRAAARAALPGGLTTREAEVLALIATGLTNAQIYVTEATVKTHINHLFTKAYQHGLGEPSPG